MILASNQQIFTAVCSSAIETGLLVTFTNWSNPDKVRISPLASSYPIGVALHDAAVGELITIGRLWAGQIYNMIAGEAILAGDKVFSTTSGRLIKQTLYGAYWNVGYALTAATVAGQSVAVFAGGPRRFYIPDEP